MSSDYATLNHLGWLRFRCRSAAAILPRLFADRGGPRIAEESRTIGTDWIRAGALPNEYLFYYYCHREATWPASHQDQTRGSTCAISRRATTPSCPTSRRDGRGSIADREATPTWPSPATSTSVPGRRLGGGCKVALDLMNARDRHSGAHDPQRRERRRRILLDSDAARLASGFPASTPPALHPIRSPL